MSVYLVTWDLNKEKSNYATARSKFINNLETFDHIKDPGLDSVYFISTDWNPSKIADDLRTQLDDNDRLFVTKLSSGNHQGWLSQNTWDWIDGRL